MASPFLPNTCLSKEKHDDRVLDVTLHYFGCLKASQRERYFNSLPWKSKQRILKEKLRIRRTRSLAETHPTSEAGIALQNYKSSLSTWRQLNGRHDPIHERSWPLELIPDESVDYDVNASIIYFKDSMPYDVPGIDNYFPNQKISVKDLLSEDNEVNPLMQPCPENVIRYFHLPANNMIWMEKVIARFHNEQRARPEDFLFHKRPQDRTKTQMLMSPEYWRGQEEGGRDSEIHARCMKPLCSTVSTENIYSDSPPKNMVLFMPYLHWETDRARTKFADAIKEASRIKFATLKDVVERVTANEPNDISPPASETTFLKYSSHPPPTPRQNKPITNRKAALGSLLRHLASVAEEMSSHVDQKMMNEYLHADPPLQPRRTLDQSYYRTLRGTQARDRDQVVYRETTPSPHDCERKETGLKCLGCQDDSHKVSRLIMVDQLWLWILDERTVISCFPRRWGKNRADSSAVHKSIRTHLKFARQNEVNSAFDLALLIVDQCSRVFFDRTIKTDQRPNLVDIFADAIGRITYSQTAAFDQFLIYTHLATKEYNSRDPTGSTSTQNVLLNVNPEGNLLKEVKDILDELHIIMRIETQQQAVAESLVKIIRQSLRRKLGSQLSRRAAVSEETGWLQQELPPPSSKDVEVARKTLGQAATLLENISTRIQELRTLQEAAKYTSSALKDILTLKQQQAGVVEAREAVKQATETLKQGRSIMLFTVVTIIFLPLSFCAAIFGMNTLEFNNSSMSLREQFTYMFPISIALIITSLLLAFARSSTLTSFLTLLSTTLLYPFNLFITYLSTKSGIFTWSREIANRAHLLKEKEKQETGNMRAEALRGMMELKAVRAAEQRGRWVEEMEMQEGSMRGGRSPGRRGDLERGGTGLGNASELGLVFSPRI